ncbi:MAG: hypothetical protein Q8N37_02950 [bacterium]|nr:hypothetical protein [bacterium]
MINDKIVSTKVILGIMVLVALGVITYYFIMLKKNPPIAVKPTPSTAIVPSISPALTPTPSIDISEWKTYTNEKYGFEIKYPEDTTVAENFNMGIIKNPFGVSFLKQNQTDTDIFYSLYIIDKNQPREMQNFFDNSEVYKKNDEVKTITIDNMEWKSYDYTGGEGGPEPLHFILNTDNLIFEIISSDDSYSNVIKTLSTFRLSK